VIEEIESLGRSDRRELKSRLEVLLQHLLKWQYQSNLRSGCWRNTIDEQRNRIEDLPNNLQVNSHIPLFWPFVKISRDTPSLTSAMKSVHPFAVILGCADSRVPPEIVFDEGLGDLFVIRVAGNILDDGTLASIEFATAELGVPLVMVLGHERCGAVAATLKGDEVPGHISRLLDAIKPALEQVKGQTGNQLDNAVRANIKMVVGQITSSKPVLTELVQQGKLKIVGGRYDLDSGTVEIIALCNLGQVRLGAVSNEIAITPARMSHLTEAVQRVV
jgi:carbonic anhydrase